VHRDIKPHNLMVTRKGQVKVLDFGLARLAEAAESDLLIAGDAPANQSTGVTTPSLVIGTPDYLAPEQAKNAHTVDIRADIYALGCVFYYLLTGRAPFAAIGAPLEKLFAHVETEPDSVRKVRPEVPAELEAILHRMMAKDPANRFATPGEAAAALKPFTRADGLIDDQPEIVEPPPLPTTAISTAALAEGPTEVRPRPSAKRSKPKKRPRSRRAWPFIAAGVLATVIFGSVGACIALSDKSKGNSDGTSAGRSSSPRGLVAGKRVLFVVPHEGLHVPDYAPVVQRLTAAGVQVDTASTATTECRGFKGARTGVTPKYLVNDVNPGDYAGVLFCGAIAAEYTKDAGAPGPGYQAVERIIKEMRASQKVVAAICLGQRVLLEFKLIPGKVPGVVAKDRLITAELPEEAPRFADAVLAALAN